MNAGRAGRLLAAHTLARAETEQRRTAAWHAAAHVEELRDERSQLQARIGVIDRELPEAEQAARAATAAAAAAREAELDAQRAWQAAAQAVRGRAA